jgi:hypothetical protein
MFPAFLVRVNSGQQGKIVGASLVFTAEFSSIGAVWRASFRVASFPCWAVSGEVSLGPL